MFVQISTDNQIVSDAESNERLEQKVRSKLKRFEARLSHVEVHVSDANGAVDKRVTLEARASGHSPVAVHAEASRVDNALNLAAAKAVRALDHALGRQKAH